MITKITISVPDVLNQKIKEKIKETEFKSVQDYIIFVLEQIVSDEGVNNEKVAYTKEEEKVIRGDQAWYTEDEGKEAYNAKDEEALKKI